MAVVVGSTLAGLLIAALFYRLFSPKQRGAFSSSAPDRTESLASPSVSPKPAGRDPDVAIVAPTTPREQATVNPRRSNPQHGNGLTIASKFPFVRSSRMAYVVLSIIPLADVQNFPKGKPVVSSMPRYVDLFAVSPNRKTVVTSVAGRNSLATELQFFDAQTGDPKGPPFSADDKSPIEGLLFTSIAFSPDSRCLLTGSGDLHWKGGEARLWDTETGKPISDPLPHLGPVQAVAFSPDGKRFATGWGLLPSQGQLVGNCGAILWDAITQKSVGAPLPSDGPIDTVCFSPDGALLLTGSVGDIDARLWKTSDGSAISVPLRHASGVTAAAISPDGQFLATGTSGITNLTTTFDGGRVHLWHLPDGVAIGQPLLHRGMVSTIEFSADSRVLVTGGADQIARMWDTAGRRVGMAMEHGARIRIAAFDPSGKIIATADEMGQGRFWNAATGEPIGPALQDTFSLAFFGDERYVLTAGYQLLLQAVPH